MRLIQLMAVTPVKAELRPLTNVLLVYPWRWNEILQTLLECCIQFSVLIVYCGRSRFIGVLNPYSCHVRKSLDIYVLHLDKCVFASLQYMLYNNRTTEQIQAKAQRNIALFGWSSMSISDAAAQYESIFATKPNCIVFPALEL